MEIFFSVVIPVYNRAHIVMETIDSILAQDYTNFELLLIDDGSKDDLEGKLSQRYSDSRLVYVSQENNERGYSRNHGYQLAKGSHVVFVDSDDLFCPGLLHALYQTILEDASAKLFSWHYQFFNGSEIIASDITKLKEGYYGIDTLIKGNPFACNICLEKSVEQWRLFVEDRKYSIMEDWIFLAQNVSLHKIKLIDFIGVSMRDHDGRSMRLSYQIITQKRLNATSYLLENLSLSPSQVKVLKGSSYEFCSIHCYIDNARKESLNYWFKAFGQLGLRKNLVILFIKIVIGIKTVGKFKRVLR